MQVEVRQLAPDLSLAYASYPPRGEKVEARQYEQRVVEQLLQQLLASDTPIQRGHHANGSPYLPTYPDYTLSITHADGCVAVLLGKAGQLLGVDVEAFRPALLKTASRYLLPEEEATYFSSEVSPLPAETRYALFWTAKEVVYKMTQPENGSLLNFRVCQLDTERRQLRLIGQADESLDLDYLLLPPFVLTYGVTPREEA